MRMWTGPKLGMLGSVQHVTWPLRGTLIRAELLSERVHRALQLIDLT
jgi:hypothetical protein